MIRTIELSVIKLERWSGYLWKTVVVIHYPATHLLLQHHDEGLAALQWTASRLDNNYMITSTGHALCMRLSPSPAFTEQHGNDMKTGGKKEKRHLAFVGVCLYFWHQIMKILICPISLSYPIKNFGIWLSMQYCLISLSWFQCRIICSKSL